MEINPNSRYMQLYDWSRVKDPITSEQLTQWLVALRSGHYEQTLSALKEIIYENDQGECTYGFCCLGVLNDLYPVENLYDTCFLKSFENEFELPNNLQELLANLNDSGGSFSSIADEIEKGFTQDATADDIYYYKLDNDLLEPEEYRPEHMELDY